MIPKVVTLGTLCSALFVCISIYLNISPDDELSIRLKYVLQGLIDVENKFKSESPKVAVGYGACNDLFVEGKQFLEFDTNVKPKHCDEISSETDLKDTFAYFFRHGAAAERYMPNSTLFDELVSRASVMDGAHFSLGGNAPLMAQRLSQEGCQMVMCPMWIFFQRIEQLGHQVFVECHLQVLPLLSPYLSWQQVASHLCQYLHYNQQLWVLMEA
ncbi:hypothetical protein J6590_046480 [Homalodisca vitripennis]|nr:hypothetical protein J6590_046480 [Homalodisca vitripennis]